MVSVMAFVSTAVTLPWNGITLCIPGLGVTVWPEEPGALVLMSAARESAGAAITAAASRLKVVILATCFS